MIAALCRTPPWLTSGLGPRRRLWRSFPVFQNSFVFEVEHRRAGSHVASICQGLNTR